MALYKKILFATDFSEGSYKACQHALEVAHLSGAQLYVLHVITELTDKRRRRLPAEVVEIFAREVETHAIADMKDFCKQYLSPEKLTGIELVTDVVIGRSEEEILRVAHAQSVDLIVLGTAGRTGIEKVLVGSTAERVIREAKVPVLTVRI